MRNLSLVIILFLVLVSISGKSQDISKYLDDGVNGTARNIISVGYDPIYTMFPVKYERKVNSSFAYVIAASPLLIEKQLWLVDVYSMKKSGPGFSASIRAKLYPKNFPERFFVSLFPQFSVMDGKLFTDACVSVGYQRVLFQKMVINIDVIAGPRFYKDSYYEDVEPESEFMPYGTVTLNVGYLF